MKEREIDKLPDWLHTAVHLHRLGVGIDKGMDQSDISSYRGKNKLANQFCEQRLRSYMLPFVLDNKLSHILVPHTISRDLIRTIISVDTYSHVGA